MPPTAPMDTAMLARKLRDLSRSAASGGRVDEQEVRHLAAVVGNWSLLLSDSYSDLPVGDILDGRARAFDPLVRSLVEAATGLPALAFRVRRLPDRIRVVGDKCLLDVGLFGRSHLGQLDLRELGARAYGRASQVLSTLADDRELRQFFRDSRTSGLTIDDEVAFLEQCSRRFATYAELLERLAPTFTPWDGERADASPEADEPGGPTDDVGEPAEGAPAPAETAPRGGPLVLVSRPTTPGAGAAADQDDDEPAVEHAERYTLSPEELLTTYERILLFSRLDIASVRRRLKSAVVQQDVAIDTLCDELSLYSTGTQNLNKPPSYFFVGPTGVGKNYLIETLSALLEDAWEIDVPVLTLEGPNYTYPSDINELRGATRGFIRSDEEGVLTEFYGRASATPFSVILIDEIEKAHAQLRRFFLSIMDRGTVTDNRGQVLNFINSMLVYTSNIGYSRMSQSTRPIGYKDGEEVEQFERSEVDRDLRRILSPEFINRVRIVHFGHLSRAAIESIFDLEFGRIADRYRRVQHLELAVTSAAKEHLIGLGYSPEYGARHLTSVLHRWCNIEVSLKVKQDSPDRTGDVAGTLGYIREMKSGDRPFDLEDVRRRVMDSARVRVPYRKVTVDLEADAIVLRESS